MHKKKLLGSTLALAMVLPFGQANAELLKGLKFGGQMDLQSTAANNVTDFTTNGAGFHNRIGDAQTRILVHGMWDVLDDVHAMVTLRKNDRTWGTVGGTAQAGTVSQPVQAAGATVLGSIYVDQAFVKVDKLVGMDATLGRQFYGESGDMVVYFGPSDKALYGLPVFAIDAARFDWSNDMVGLTGIVGKQVGHALGVAGTADTDLQGINAALKGNEALSAGAYVYRQLIHNVGTVGLAPNTTNAGGRNSNLFVAGLKAKAMLGSAAWIGAEVAKNFGTQRQQETATAAGTRKYTGMAAKLDAGMKAELSGIGSLAPWVHLGYGSGDNNGKSNENNGFVAIQGDYRPGTIMGRFANIAGANAAGDFGGDLPGTAAGAFAGNGTLSNRVVVGGGVKVAPGMAQKLTVGLSAWNFRTQTSALPTTGARPFAGKKNIGTELDLDLTWKHSDNVSLGAGAARFVPGGVIKEAISPASAGTGRGNNSANLAYFDVRVKWGN